MDNGLVNETPVSFPIDQHPRPGVSPVWDRVWGRINRLRREPAKYKSGLL